MIFNLFIDFMHQTYSQVFKDVRTGGASNPYMTYKADGGVTDMQFCPYEDILGVSTYRGYSSLIIPGM